MTTEFQLTLSNDNPTAVWGEKNSLSFTESGGQLHLKASDAEAVQLKQIQKAGRKLAAMNLPALKLCGEWSQRQQWQLWQGLYQPTSIPAITWAEMSEDESAALNHKITVFSWVKQIINQTPEDLSPQKLAENAGEFISKIGGNLVSYQITSGEDLKQRKLAGIYAVGRGSERPPALLELDFCPKGQQDNAPVATLVGKGITFDSGGYSLKSSQGMLYMKADMGGAATVTGALALAILNGLQQRVKLILCCAENLVSGHAYKLSDILQYKNGVSVEVVNTDAEGRLVLADGLILASESKAPNIIDAATLTGAAHVAVGEHYNALFAMDDNAAARFVKAANETHDPVWRLPLEAFHQDECPSDYADTANSRSVPGGGAGGASNAAGFLSRFVEKPDQGWLHLDLAGCFQDSGNSLWSAGATGMGVEAISHYLEQL